MQLPTSNVPASAFSQLDLPRLAATGSADVGQGRAFRHGSARRRRLLGGGRAGSRIRDRGAHAAEGHVRALDGQGLQGALPGMHGIHQI